MFGKRLCLLSIALVFYSSLLLSGQTARGTFASQAAAVAASDVVLQPPETAQPDWMRPPFPPRVPVSPPGGLVFPHFVRVAGMIFSGTVTKIERRATTHGQPIETVVVTFHVDRAIRGATPGQELVISQWIGLWSTGQRYRLGERMLLFLYPPSKLGLTSSVGGSMGRFALDPWGRVLLTAQHLSAFQTDPVLGGKSRVRFSDFALAVERAEEESTQ